MFRTLPNTFSFKLQNKEIINVDEGTFDGDTEKASKFIQDFCAKNNISIESYGYGYGKLTVNDTKHSITPYGIDLKMMVEYCGGRVVDFTKNVEQKATLTNVSSTLFSDPKQAIVVKRRSDILTVVDVLDISKVTPNEIKTIAAKDSRIPSYNPDGAGAMLIFYTESGTFILGGIRSNPVLDKELTKDNTSFPQQINSTIGGYLPNSEVLLKSAIVSAIKNKMFLSAEFKEESEGFKSQQVLQELCAVIEDNNGWGEKICVHTDQWTNDDNSTGTMCYLTAIKHIHASDTDLEKIDKSLKTIMDIKKGEGVNSKTLSAFKFVPLKPIIENSLATHLEDDITQAKNAFAQFGNEIVVTFNALAVATLAKNKALRGVNFAELTFGNVPRKTF